MNRPDDSRDIAFPVIATRFIAAVPSPFTSRNLIRRRNKCLPVVGCAAAKEL
jgi:hypothetical protein